MNLMSSVFWAALSYLRRFWLVIAIIVIVGVVAVGYVAGYRVGPGLTVVRAGTLAVIGVPPGTQVFVDYALRGVSESSSVRADLVPGTHTVIVNAGDDYYPWDELVAISPKTENVQIPVLVKKNIPRAKLPGPALGAGYEAIAATRLPTAANPVAAGCALISVSDNRIIASPATSTPSCGELPYACTNGVCSPTIVFAPIDPVKAIVPYPYNDAAIIVLAGDKLYVLEVDPRAPQFFAPLLSGTNLQLGVEEGAGLVLMDGGTLYALAL